MKHHLCSWLFFLFMIAGCQAPLPVFPWRGSDAALSDLSERSAKLRSATGTATLTLTRADGASVRVDSAFAMKQPDFLRIRAWKMNRAVADWTMRPEGVWVWQAQSPDEKSDANQAGPWSAHHADIWPLLFGVLRHSDNDQLFDDGGPDLIVRRPVGRITAVVIIEKRTLVVRECRIEGGDGAVVQRVTLRRHRMMGEFPWPMVVTAQGEAGAFELNFDIVAINEEPPDGAFDPPARARPLK